MADTMQVKVPLVVATDSTGAHRYIYQGGVVPDDIPADEVKRLREAKFIEPLTEDVEPLTEDVEPLTEDVEPLTEDVKPLTEDVEPESTKPRTKG